MATRERIISNAAMTLHFSEQGCVEKFVLNDDPHQMNWVIDPAYLRTAGYPDEDKLFGHFTVQTGGVKYESGRSGSPVMRRTGTARMELVHLFPGFEVRVIYVLDAGNGLSWDITLRNTGAGELVVDGFNVWCSLAYVMFKDPDVNRNINHSCAVFPSISQHFSKFACMRRSNRGPHLGLYAAKGATRSMGTWCRFENHFFKNVSPSLDGLLYHQLVLAGTGSGDSSASDADWIYMKDAGPAHIHGGGSMEWEYRFLPFDDRRGFYENAAGIGHPVIDYAPITPAGGVFEAGIQLPVTETIALAELETREDGGIVLTDAAGWLEQESDRIGIRIGGLRPREYKLSITLTNGKTDSIVFNVTEPVKTMLEARADYICRNLYAGPDSETPHAFLPLSNQGESLGKAAFVLMKNAFGARDVGQVRKVENSAVHYIRPKWFENGEFGQPAKLYGHFYRIFDLDYVAHVFYLLSKFRADELEQHTPEQYLSWAAEVMIVRMDERLHQEERERKETQMLGVYYLFMVDLLTDLQKAGFIETYERLSDLWKTAAVRLCEESLNYRGAVTEHYYDNAGFGPAFEALCHAGHLSEAARYGELLLANIGFSNDFRAQNPDRWWESLSYMIHSLWGGLTAAATLAGYEKFHRSEYLLAAYRATAAMLYCYDWHATATRTKLGRGEAASTYSVAGPHLNRPDLSRNRFGQSAFREVDGDIFKGLFQEDSGYDWDMGEELAAYLAGFGTKTFLYRENGEIRCVNGEIAKEGNGYTVTSYAAYPKEYHFYDDGASYVCAPGEEIRTIIYEKGRFRQTSP